MKPLTYFLFLFLIFACGKGSPGKGGSTKQQDKGPAVAGQPGRQGISIENMAVYSGLLYQLEKDLYFLTCRGPRAYKVDADEAIRNDYRQMRSEDQDGVVFATINGELRNGGDGSKVLVVVKARLTLLQDPSNCISEEIKWLEGFGNEPGWYVRVNPFRGRIEVALNYGEKKMAFPYQGPQSLEGVINFTLDTSDGNSLGITFTPGQCMDDMSGEGFGYKVEITTTEGKVHQGCGKEKIFLDLIKENEG